MRKELLIGCGGRRKIKYISLPGREQFEDLVTLDINESHRPDVVWDLDKLPYPFKANEFDEIHAYEVLEHCGRQGDWRFFFDQFSEFHRILKSGGYLIATCPSYKSAWAWGDPSHTRVLTAGTLTFLDQSSYLEQIGRTPMTDFRFCYKAHFESELVAENDDQLKFVLRAVK